MTRFRTSFSLILLLKFNQINKLCFGMICGLLNSHLVLLFLHCFAWMFVKIVSVGMAFLCLVDHVEQLSGHNFWRRRQCVNEQLCCDPLLTLISTLWLQPDSKDVCLWKPLNGPYSTEFFLELTICPIDKEQGVTFDCCWKTLAPPRVQFFCWVHLHE